MASAAPFTGNVPPMPAVARILSRFQRPQIEGFIAVALDLLDVLDGDVDIEDDELNDDPLDVGEAQDIIGVLTTKPIYRVDQTLGPINEGEALAIYKRAQHPGGA